MRLFWSWGTDKNPQWPEMFKAVGFNAITTAAPRTPRQQQYLEQTAAGASLHWHNAPHRQYVITLSGRLEFETRKGDKQTIEPGDILLAEDTTGGGHRWRLIDDQPWRRAYITVP